MSVNPLAGLPAAPVAGVEVKFVQVTPALAAEWLKRNRRNRKLKTLTVEALATDIRNEAWLVTHQGVAFNAAGELIDGQHRLEAVVAAKRAVTVMASWGWAVNGKQKVMDAVDRGVQRSLADQLSVQHGMEDAGRVVQLVNGIAAACFGSLRVRKSTTNNVLAVLELYLPEIRWALNFRTETRGLRLAAVASSLALARVVWPETAELFFQRLLSGENLSGHHPILPLRNWLMDAGSLQAVDVLRAAVLEHVALLHQKGNSAKVLLGSEAAYRQIMTAQAERVRKVCAIYGARPPEWLGEGSRLASAKKAPEAVRSALGPGGIAVGASLAATFSSTDLRARLDEGEDAGQWLMQWRNKGWITSAGVREFRKTADFPKAS
jgi:hypothetical protein